MDPNFHQTVLLLMEFHDEGAMGLVINRPLSVTLGSVLADAVTLADDYSAAPLWFGGPVESNHILCLYDRSDHTPAPNDTVMGDGLALAPASVLLESADAPYQFPGPYRIIAGHAGWAPQQLDREIQEGAWLVAPLAVDLVFSPEPEKVWTTAFGRLGVNPAQYHDAPSKTLN